MKPFSLASLLSKKDLLKYFALTYVDKVVSFALPLFILLLLRDSTLYTLIEVSFSYALLIVVVIDAGLSSFMFFGYRNATNKDEFLNSAQRYFRFLLICYSLIAVLGTVVIALIRREVIFIFMISAVRTLFVFYSTFYSNVFRLQDRPSAIYRITLTVNLAAFILLAIAQLLEMPWRPLFFIAPFTVLLLADVSRFLLSDAGAFYWRQFRQFMASALSFSWPIIVNVLAMSYVNNYAKIYAFNHLGAAAALQVSYVMRIGLLIQLTHSAFSAYFAKSLYMDASRAFNRRIFRQYNLVLGGACMMAVIVIGITQVFFGHLVAVQINLATCLFLLYILMWCYIGYLEMYFSILNANKLVLLISLMSCGIYTLMLFLSPVLDLELLAFYMVCAAALNLSLSFFGLVRLNVLNFKGTAKPS